MSEKISQDNSRELKPTNGGQPEYTPAQKAVAEVWAEVLEKSPIAIADNFFDLGGDSLKAMEVIARLHASLGVEIPLLAFFEDPTLAHAAEVVDSLQPEPKPRGMTSTQSAIAKLWSEVLQAPVTAASQNFFDLGGDSLKAMEVISRVHAALGVEFPLIAFFEDPTVAHAAAVVDSLRPEETAPLTQAKSEGPLPLSFPQLTFWLLEQRDPLGYLYIEPRVIRIAGKLRADLLQQALDAMCRRHDSMHTRFVVGEDEPSQIVVPDAHLDLPVQDLSSAPLRDAERAGMAIARKLSQQPFDLSLEAPIRARLLRLAAEDHILVVVIHHVLSDGHTCAIFFEELGQIYSGLLRGSAPALPEARQYQEYAQWERTQMQGPRLDEAIAYWSQRLDGAPAKLDLPTDKQQPPKASFQGASRSVRLRPELVDQLKSLAQANGTTLFSVLMAGLRILLHRWTGQQDIVIGTVVSNRSRAETERMLGCFLNFLPLRGSTAPQDSASNVLIRERAIVMDAFAHQAPFVKVAAIASGRHASSPVYNVALLLQNFPEMKFEGDDFSAQFLEQEVETALLDLRLIAQEISGGLRIDCDFKTDLFEPETISELLKGYTATLASLTREPSRLVSQFEIPAKLAEQADAARRREKKLPVVVASTFTAEPIESGLAFWMKELGLPSEFHFAPYNQVFQQLLDPESRLGQNREGFNVLLVRPTDWQRFETNADAPTKRERIAQSLQSLIEALKSRAWSAPLLLCFCPAERKYSEDSTWHEFLERVELQVASEMSSVPGVHVVSSQDILTRYPVENSEDEYADRIGHIPFTQEFFNAIATMLARRIFSLRSTPRKVIVLDCDNTLWKGVCGEDGPAVLVDAPRKTLQEFMLDQQKAGMLLCLCSKNVEEDVDAVFAENRGMVLRPEDIAARRVNWNPKSQNLRELASMLQLGIDSFIFVDDNPLECAEVEASCPEVLTLQLPQDAGEIPQFLNSIWAFDHWKVTQEDAQRTAMYRQNAEREQLRQQSTSLNAFLASLDLRLDIRPMEAVDLARVSQLTERTNQFNFTTIRRDEAAVTKFLEAGGECLVVTLADRFGDYGLVGVMFYKTGASALEVDTLLLSCRALGRKVEHNMLARLGAIARERTLERVIVTFAPTKKNQPASDFLNSVGERFRDSKEQRIVFDFPAKYLSELPLLELPTAARTVPDSPKALSVSSTSRMENQNRLVLRVANQLGQISSINRAIDVDRVHRSSQAAFVAPRTPVEEMVAGIWAQVLKIDSISVNDNFFTLGGQSLLATQVIARIRHVLGVELPLRTAFEASTIRELSTRIEAAQRAGSGLQVPPIARRAKTSTVPLSFAQQRLWFLDQLEPGNPLYNIAQMLRMRGPLDLTALHRSLNQIVERHESLRTRFGLKDGEPVQIVAPYLELPLPVLDLSDSDHGEDELRARAKEEVRKPFDLARGPLLRAEVLRLGSQDHALLLTMHHMISDRWSLGVMATELASHYEAFATGRTAAVPSLPVQYSDYAVWQRRWLEGPALAQQADYWKRQLTGAPAVLELPTDRPRPAAMTNRGATLSLTLPRELLSKLVTLSQGEGVTLFMTLMAGFQSLLARYSGQDDIVVGSPIANRQQAEVESLIGFFVNTLAIRGDLSGNPSFRQVLARTKNACLQAYAHQDIPFEKLVEELNPERSLSYSPIFQVMFALQNAPMEAPRLQGLAVERSMVYPDTSMFDMSWFAIEVPEGLMLRAEYSTDLFDRETVSRTLGHFRQLLQSAVANPELRISQLSILGEAERQKILVEFNSSEAAFPTGLCLHDLVEQTAARLPDLDAVVCESQRLCYRELNQRANQIAHYLIENGAGPDVLVGVFLERNLDLLPAILGVLKSGSAYVPLDPSYPRERLAAILEDGKAPLVITQQSLVDQVEASGARCVCVDSDWGKIGRGSTQNPDIKIEPHHLAYVLFTSGSTGRPKGVALEHQSAVTFVHWAQTVFTPRELAGVLLATSVCFDLSIFEIFAPLSVGGKVILVQNALYLPSAEAKEEVTLINTVPSAMAELVQMNAVPSSVKTINLAGEALPESLVNDIYRETSVEKLYNLYGPTEDTTYSTYTLTQANERVTIGRPLPNTQAYVVDAHGNPQPIGVPGELHLAGAGLARGYYGRPDLTSERFLPNPFSTKKNARMYRTGDLCRWLPDGNLEYLGRLDYQVKLRGFRIELGEIESVLSGHAKVRQCLVMAREDEPGRKRLVAYVVPDSGAILEDDMLREHLKRRLPEFMVPQAFVVLDAFPLSPNGKINRKALPAPESKAPAEGYIAPRSPIEEVVAGIWAVVLRLPQVGVNDEFFSLGGHSLLATQVVSRIRQACRVEVPLRALFETPTVAGLAALIEKAGDKSGDTEAPPMLRVRRDQELPLSFAQQRLWFLDQLEPDNPFYNIPQGLRMHGELDRAALEKSLTEIVGRHEVLRTTYKMVDGRAVQFIAPQPNLKIESVDLTGLPEAERETEAQTFAAKEARRPFRIDQGPVMRAYLLQLADREHILILNTHHVASDGWSMALYVRELSELYSAFVEGKPSPLAELPIQYADFALWQRKWMQGKTLERHMTYWRKQLEGAPTTLELPTDRPRPAVQTFRGQTRSLRLPLETLDRLKKLSQAEGTTLYMTLLAAFQTLLYRYTGQEDIVVGSPIANRNRAEIEDLIGFFVNALTMRTKLAGNPTFRELMARVREVALEAYAHQDLPFEKLVEEFDPERSLGHNPLFQVLFVLQNAPRIKLDLPGLKLEWLNLYSGTAKFDLALHIAERQDGLNCMMEFNTDLFEETTVARMLGHYQTLLEAIVADPDRPIASLPILTTSERQKLLVEFNHAGTNFAPQHCIHELVEAQAARTPHKIALVFENHRLTYRELNQRANQLAHFLQKNGVGPETLVGMCIDRSLEMVVGIIAILKAGGAYLPFDIAYPPERLAFMIDDAKPPIVLTQEKLIEQLPAHGAQIVCLDRDWPTIAAENKENPSSGARPENLAYVIYTSGSTGKPKGCLVTHYNVVRLMQATWDWYEFDEHDVWTMFHSYAFDFSVWELWGALFYGGRVVIVPYLVSRSPEEFYRLLADESVTVLNQTPSSFRQLMQAEERVGIEKLALRYVVFGGEALDMQSLKPWFERHGDHAPKLINMYGITETTVHVTYRPISNTDTNGGSVIGQPIPDLQLYILDQHRQPLPIGIPGEMYVGGAGVARGYLNRPELTAERFIADPFSTRPGARLYKTGDLARYLPNGDVEYLGRIDHQVKIRGFRIELGEIESVISEHPAVRNSIVLVREDEPGNKQLVAYVVANKNYQGEAEPSRDRNLKDEQVSQWEMTFDETYSQGSDDDPEFNIVGWNSSYSGQPYPAEHMREWVDSTVERIRALKPKSLLEIGCGTGLLLLRIAPHCRKYFATDFSEKAITRLRRITHQRGLSQVSLAARMGDDFAGIEPDSFDTAVINSVLQYFPSIDYLMTVMEGMIRAVAPGGKIFLGDIRSLPLLEAFHAAVQLEQSPGSLATDQFAQRIRQRVAQDEELVLDPALFHELKRREPKVGRVEIQIKRGRHRNEMTQFRYDVVLHIGWQAEATVDCAWLDWKTQDLSVGMLGKILQESKCDVLAVSGIPNARVAEEVAALRWLGQKKRPANVEQVKALIRQESVGTVAPEDVWEAADSQGFDAEINWSAAGNSALDVVFRRRGGSAASAPIAGRVPEERTAPKPWSFYANNPLAGKIVRNLVPQLRQRATEKLPEYMVPSAFVVLDNLPLTENGKVDRRALPAPDQLRPELEGKYVAPRTPTEELVAGIWAEVLKIERVGVQDNFFDLGGHSLNATQVTSRVRESFKVEMPLRALFESPTVEALARTIGTLKHGEAANQRPAMVALARDQQLPLSFAQQRLWFLDQMDPGNHLYNVPRAFRLAGDLDVGALERALNDLIARHEILRTNYTIGDRDQPVQVIAVEMKVELARIDLSGTDSVRREQEAQRIVQEEADRGFDLARDPMLRALLVKLSDADHVLFMNTHHIASDGWSTGVMVNDLCALYEAAAANKTAPLPPLSIQYADYSCWQRSWLQGEVLDQQLSYWREQLAGAPPLLALPTDRPRPSLQTYRGAMVETAVSRNITEGLNAVGRQHGATIFMTMLAGFECLMHYSTGQSDIVLGTDLANRTSLETEALIGFFVNLLPLRVDVSGDPTFIELIGRVRDVSLNAYAHQDVPFDKLVEELKPERNLSYSPLVQVLFVQQNTPRATATMPGIEMSRFKMQVQSKFDMAVFMRETGGEVAGSWQYNPDLFEQATISRLASSYEVLLQAAISNPKARVSSLCEVLAEADRTHRGSEQVKVQKAGLEKLKAIRRKAVADV